MKRWMLAALAAGLTAAAGQAAAAEFWLTGRSPQTIITIDADSIAVLTPTTRTASEYTVYGNDSPPGRAGLRAAVNVLEYDCAQRRTRTLSITAYDTSNTVAFNKTTPTEWRPVVANSVGETATLFVCGSPNNRPSRVELRPERSWDDLRPVLVRMVGAEP